MRSLRVSLKAREGWTAILPFEELQDVTWADAYNLNNDAFAMGNFAQYFPAEQTGGAAVYGVAGEEGQFPQEVASGIATLRAYYAERFGTEEQPYQIILLPTEEGDVIGGAGVHSVCATFDAADRRDWELLQPSHVPRLFRPCGPDTDLPCRAKPLFLRGIGDLL